ncbi:MAG: beta-galactosidase [Lachnospiraceae bacterium]
MLYGVSYYPEHKNENDLEHDIQLLIESGINTVRMGEFAWCKMEPVEGEYHFEWLLEVVNRLGEAGIHSIICTPTACPPAWMIEKYPDILYMDNRRIRRPFGGRRHYCYNNEKYREYCANITEEIGKAFGANPYVIGYQIDNEPAQEGTGRCCCPTCTRKFQNWLENKYETIDQLNKRSGGIFWSQEYTKFSQIQPPVNTIEVGAQQQIHAFYENPTICLEFERFSRVSHTAFQNIHLHILKTYTIQPITTNATGLATNSINYFDSTKELDCYAFDYYPSLRDAQVDSFPYAFARGVKQGKPFWVLEFMSGGGHRLSGSGRLQPNPGALKQAVIQSFAHGADMMLHFQFRSFPFGAEQLNYAIVDMDGIPRRRYFEMKETASMLKRLEVLADAQFSKEVAICMDYDSHWALRIKPVNDPAFHYIDYCGRIYRNLEKIGVNADVVSLDQDWSKYKMVILPAAFLVPANKRRKLDRYVREGGIVVATFLTSVKNEDNVGYTESLPAGLNELFGITVEEVEPVFTGNQTNLKMQLGKKEVECKDGMWSELISGKAKMIGYYTEGYKEGAAAVSSHPYGKGGTYYVGTDLNDFVWKQFFIQLCEEHDISRNPLLVPDEVEVVRRTMNEKSVYFVFNFAKHSVDVGLPYRVRDFMTKQIYEGSVEIEQNGVSVLLEI